MKTFLLSTGSSNENYNADHDYAVVEIEDIGLRRLNGMREAWRLLRHEMQKITNDPNIHISLECTWFDNWPDFYSRTWEEDWPEGYETAGYWQPPTPFQPESDPERTECTRIHISADGVYWTSVPKHSDVLITTAEIPWNQLEVEDAA